LAVTKIKPIRATIEKSIAYICNSDKTESCLFVSSEHCVPETAALEFQFLLDKARAGGNTIGRHLIQSFKPGEVTPQQAHEIGQKMADEILGGQYAYVLATHLDRDHIHNHYIWCAVNIETHRRYVSNKTSYRKIQGVSDRFCGEYNLSVITEKSGQRGKGYTEYQADKYGASWKSLLRITLDAAIRSSGTFDEFRSFMREAGYEIKHGKHITFRAAGQERFTRAKTVGDNYTEERIRERIGLSVTRHPSPKPSIDKIIDRSEEKIQSSPGYRNLATLHNLKTMAATHNYLVENHGTDLAEFERHYAECIARRDAAQSAFDKAVQRNAADKLLGIAGRIKQHDVLKASHAKEMKSLNTEIAEMERIRENTIAVHGETFYKKHSQRGAAR
jgi:hypothetical protein